MTSNMFPMVNDEWMVTLIQVMVNNLGSDITGGSTKGPEDLKSQS